MVDSEFSRWMRLTDIYARLCARSMGQTPTAMARLRRIAVAIASVEAGLSGRDRAKASLGGAPNILRRTGPVPDFAIPEF